MKAVGYRKSLPIDAADALIDFEAAKPEPRGHAIRVAVKALSANPVDYKVRKRAAPPEGETKILGYDAAGIVDAVGPDVSLFKPGDEVFYAGSIQRQGTNSEFHLVDERIVGRKPKSLSFAQAAALPLPSITAWELLFDRLGAVPGKSVDPRALYGLIQKLDQFDVLTAARFEHLAVVTQDRTKRDVLGAYRCREPACHFGDLEHHGQVLLLGRTNHVQEPRAAQTFVPKAQGGQVSRAVTEAAILLAHDQR